MGSCLKGKQQNGRTVLAIPQHLVTTHKRNTELLQTSARGIEVSPAPNQQHPKPAPEPRVLLAYPHLTPCSPHKHRPCHPTYLLSNTLPQSCSQTTHFSFHGVSVQCQGYKHEPCAGCCQTSHWRERAGWEVSKEGHGVNRQVMVWRWS